MTTRLASIALLLLAFGKMAGASKVALAQDDSGFEGGVRLGYGVPLGEPAGLTNADLNELIGGMIPIWLDLGYRVNESIFIGAYGHYGFGFLGDTLDAACTGPLDCSTSDIRIGAQLHYHVMPRGPADLWLGAGFGYEWLNMSAEGGGLEVSSTASGFEFLNLQIGLDFEAAQQFYLGPFLSFSLDQYDQVSVDGTGAGLGAGGDGDIEDKSLHHWLVIGLRAAFAP